MRRFEANPYRKSSKIVETYTAKRGYTENSAQKDRNLAPQEPEKVQKEEKNSSFVSKAGRKVSGFLTGFMKSTVGLSSSPEGKDEISGGD